MTEKIIVSQSEDILNLSGISGRIFHQSTNLELVEITIEPGKTIEKHQMPIDVIFYLIDGELGFEIDMEKIILKPSEVLEVKAFSDRVVTNSKLNNAKLLVIKKMGKSGKKALPY